MNILLKQMAKNKRTSLKSKICSKTGKLNKMLQNKIKEISQLEKQQQQ